MGWLLKHGLELQLRQVTYTEAGVRASARAGMGGVRAGRSLGSGGGWDELGLGGAGAWAEAGALLGLRLGMDQASRSSVGEVSGSG
jgi:hypothetical protein